MQNLSNYYDETFFNTVNKEGLEAAKIIVPLVLDIIQPSKVIDVGCGAGAWLSVFKDLGVENILGLDGDYITPSQLFIPKDSFRAINLAKPFKLNDDFDLAVSLEVAEHIPETKAFTFIDNLCQLAPVILFSAAVPGQRGTNHVNEQWPSYWRTLFLQHNYRMFDPIRPLIWQKEEIPFYYRQNLFLVVRDDIVKHNILFSSYHEVGTYYELTLVANYILDEHSGFVSTFKTLPPLFKRAIERRLRTLLGKEIFASLKDL